MRYESRFRHCFVLPCQVYNSGEACDLTQAARSAEVHYSCSETREGIQAVQEHATCMYLVLVSTPRLCTHARLRTKEIATSRIACHAVGLVPGTAPGFGGSAQRAIYVPKTPEAEASSARLGSESLLHGLLRRLGAWWGGHGWDEGVGDDVGQIRLSGEEGRGQEAGARGQQDAALGLELGPDAVQALAHEVQRTLLAAFGQGGGREGARAPNEAQAARMQRDMEQTVADAFSEHLQGDADKEAQSSDEKHERDDRQHAAAVDEL